jgi:hypothetical protein
LKNDRKRAEAANGDSGPFAFAFVPATVARGFRVHFSVGAVELGFVGGRPTLWSGSFAVSASASLPTGAFAFTSKAAFGLLAFFEARSRGLALSALLSNFAFLC